MYVTGAPGNSASALVWVDREGNEEALAAEPHSYVYPASRPDETHLALDIRDQEQDIRIWDFARETLTQLGPSRLSCLGPAIRYLARREAFLDDPGDVS